MNWSLLIPILVGAVCALLGYLLGRFLRRGSNHDDCNKRISSLETDLEACKKSRIALESDLKLAKSSNTNVASSFAAANVAATAFNADAAKAVYGKKIKENDLTVVEGIGPKIQELFHNHDVKTWKALSECSIDKCNTVLISGGNRFKVHKPDTWPNQAKLAYQGRWADLKTLQDELDGGR